MKLHIDLDADSGGGAPCVPHRPIPTLYGSNHSNAFLIFFFTLFGSQ